MSEISDDSTAIHKEIRTDLLSDIDLEIILQKHLIERKSFYFNNILRTPDVEYNIRLKISRLLNIHINDVMIVGSAKLGFSPKTIKFVSFDEGIDKNGVLKRSDIDIAIINRDYFDKITYEIYKMSSHFSKKWIGNHWENNRYSKKPPDPQVKIYSLYTEYIAKGWFRPDYAPEIFLTHWELDHLIKDLRRQLNRKVSVGVYSSWMFFKHYQMDNFNTLRLGLATGDDFK